MRSPQSTNAFTEKGGIRVGLNYWLAWNLSVPFARLSGTKHELRLSALGKVYAFKPNEHLKLSRFEGLISTGIRFEQADSKLPKFLVFWTLDFERVKQQLEALGYKIN